MKLRWVAVHLTALWTLAFVQPLFDLLGKNAEFFVARDNTGADILIFAFGWALVPPLVMVAMVAVLGRRAHLVLVALLVAVLALQPFTGVPAGLGFALAIAIGAGAALAYARAEPIRTFVSILGVAPVVVLALLLVFSPVGDLLSQSGAATGEGAEVNDAKPVVVLIFDELPTTTLMTGDKRIDAERYPSFAELAAGSTWYRNATSVADGTYVAVPATLTGVRPQAELPTSREYPLNLFNLLGRDYAHHAQEPLTSVCPEELCGARPRPPQGERLRSLASDLSIVERRLLLPDSLADDLPAVDQDFEDFQGDDLAEVADEVAAADSPAGKPIRVAGDDLPAQRVRAARGVVRTMSEPEERGLWMIHNVVPHVPWRFLPDGSQYPVLGPTYPGLDDVRWGRNPFLLAQAEQRHVLMTRFADRLLGDAIAQMKQSGLWDDALVIVVADHGGNISAGELRRNTATENFAQIAGIPLFVRRPGEPGGAVSDAFVTALDVMPTIVKELEIDTDWEFDGIPLDEPREPELLQQRNGPDAKLVGVTPEAFERDFAASLRERLERLPPGLAPIFGVGPRRDLLGRPLSDLTVTDGDRGAFLNNAPLYGAVERTSGVLPVYVTGSTNGVAPGTDLIVAVNGTIAASGEAYVDHGDPRFSMLVAPAELERGDNRIEILAVDGETAERLVSTG